MKRIFLFALLVVLLMAAPVVAIAKKADLVKAFSDIFVESTTNSLSVSWEPAERV